MYDIALRSTLSTPQNFIGMVLVLKPKMLNTRFKFITEGKIKKPKDYEELKQSRFYNLVDLPYVTPTGARYVILNNKTGNGFYNFRQKKAEKLKLHNLDEIDQDWIDDYKALSEH
ncbi:MAG: hypothetical protein ACTSSN_13870 [Candidatus Heimdallarchaeaceae archaeon]